MLNALAPSDSEGENEFTNIGKFASTIKEFFEKDDDDFEVDSYERFTSKINELSNTDLRTIQNEDGSSLSDVVNNVSNNNCGSVQFDSTYRRITTLSCDVTMYTYQCDYLTKIKTFFDAIHKAQETSFPNKYLETIEELTEQLENVEKILEKIEKIVSLFDGNIFSCSSNLQSNYNNIHSSVYKYSHIKGEGEGAQATFTGNSNTSLASIHSVCSCVLIFSGVMSVQYSKRIPEPTNSGGDMALKANNNDQGGDMALKVINNDQGGDIGIKRGNTTVRSNDQNEGQFLTITSKINDE